MTKVHAPCWNSQSRPPLHNFQPSTNPTTAPLLHTSATTHSVDSRFVIPILGNIRRLSAPKTQMKEERLDDVSMFTKVP